MTMQIGLLGKSNADLTSIWDDIIEQNFVMILLSQSHFKHIGIDREDPNSLYAIFHVQDGADDGAHTSSKTVISWPLRKQQLQALRREAALYLNLINNYEPKPEEIEPRRKLRDVCRLFIDELDRASQNFKIWENKPEDILVARSFA